jgi:hypothetical protein
VSTPSSSLRSALLGSILVVPALLVVALSLLMPRESGAVPAYARQTGQNCVACHAGGQFPELTPYGRLFKLTGYTIGKRTIPLSGMAVADFTSTRNTGNDPHADFPKNDSGTLNVASVFLAGKIIDNLGIFGQWTYDFYDHQNNNGQWVGHFLADNFDLRYADRLNTPQQDWIFGVSLNNNPTVEDVWNSTPAWGYPYQTSAFALMPSAAPLIAGGLAQSVAGLTAYAYWNQTVYAAVGAYKTADNALSFLSLGVQNGDLTKLDSPMPYWRLALTHNWGPHSMEVGTFGLSAQVYPDSVNPHGPTSHYLDVGVDAQYEYLLDPHTITAQMTYIHENVNWASPLVADGSVSNSSDTLDSFNLKGTYVYKAKYGLDLDFFNLSGSTDAGLYPGTQVDDNGNLVPIPVTGSINNNPGARGWIAEVFWKPIQYVRLGVQYWFYNRFNGASGNYDGAGRSASDNNFLYVYLWGVY